MSIKEQIKFIENLQTKAIYNTLIGKEDQQDLADSYQAVVISLLRLQRLENKAAKRMDQIIAKAKRIANGGK